MKTIVSGSDRTAAANDSRRIRKKVADRAQEEQKEQTGQTGSVFRLVIVEAPKAPKT